MTKQMTTARDLESFKKMVAALGLSDKRLTTLKVEIEFSKDGLPSMKVDYTEWPSSEMIERVADAIPKG